MSRSATKAARTVLPRYFSTAVARGGAAGGASPIRTSVHGGAVSFFGGAPKSAENAAERWMRFPVLGSRNASTAALSEKKDEEEKVNGGSVERSAPAGGDGKDNKGIVSYWGVERAKITKEDGSEWRWNSFMVRSKRIYTEFTDFISFYLFSVLILMANILI